MLECDRKDTLSYVASSRCLFFIKKRRSVQQLRLSLSFTTSLSLRMTAARVSILCHNRTRIHMPLSILMLLSQVSTLARLFEFLLYISRLVFWLLYSCFTVGLIFPCVACDSSYTVPQPRDLSVRFAIADLISFSSPILHKEKFFAV